ncbi:hypothetical protein GS501_07535 [Saccharibacter sp. 17.LH.SD]|nr:hypothetical protein [Saccharibacter sp. 17.LH.SD]MXV44890.1 hypothetical protein [Saccharibacter sp. 17.LH.SD]
MASVMGGTIAHAAPAAGGMSASECRKAFQQAKKDGTLNGQKYAAFKSAQCSSDKTQDAEKKTVAAPATPSQASADKAPVAAPAARGDVVFPTQVSSEYSTLSPGKARMKTCLAQYNANKANGGNGSLKWIQKGGGYYSECNARLKK